MLDFEPWTMLGRRRDSALGMRTCAGYRHHHRARRRRCPSSVRRCARTVRPQPPNQPPRAMNCPSFHALAFKTAAPASALLAELAPACYALYRPPFTHWPFEEAAQAFAWLPRCLLPTVLYGQRRALHQKGGTHQDHRRHVTERRGRPHPAAAEARRTAMCHPPGHISRT